MNWKRLAPALAAACSVTALAGAASADPPGRVGRISDVEGLASFRPVDEDFWAPALRNTPVTTGEGFWTGDGARLELQVAGLEARVDRQTSLDVLDLDYGVTRLSLAQGSIDLHIWRAPRGGVLIETAEGEVRIDQPGVYRIDALPAAGDDGDYGPVEVTVFEGQAFAPSDGGPVEVDAGQSLTYLPGYDVDVEYAQETGVDQWARARDAREAEIRRRDDLWDTFTGAADLDEYGDWADQPGYGRVWFPREAGPDWAPYRFGHWSFVRPWGWTWVDDRPWGFAPFHYGRWARFGDRWGWIPGEREAEPVYAPALVAFIGGGGWGVSIGVGGDAMGWVPLAPGEAYVPAYHVSGDYVRRVNAPHVSQTVINNIVVNNTVVINRTEVVYRNAPAATVVPTAAFSRGASVQKAAVAVPPAALARAPRAAPLEQVAPTREARAGVPTGQGASSGAPAGGPSAFANAPQPPAKVMTLRAAVAAQPAGATRPQITLRPAAPAPSAGGKPLQPHTGPERQGWSVPRMPASGPNGPPPNGQGWNGARPSNPGPNGPAPNGQGWNGARPNTPGPNGSSPNGQGGNGARPNSPGPNGPAPNGQGWNGARPNNPGPNGPSPNGQGGNGSRPNTPGPNGPAPNGENWNGSRPNTPGPNGPAPNGQGWNGARPNNPGPNGPAPNGQGWNGSRPNTPGPNGSTPNSSGAPQQPTFRSQTPPPPAPPAPRRDQAQPRPAPHAAPPSSDKPNKPDKKDDKTKS